ncbi:hypothetical protein BC834DRAFT_375626 [Gloeopeniophorella convolvens]|nr:hypothetical protein BC834DRAFT_375626 [Gloeopeniophorella convolvens]
MELPLLVSTEPPLKLPAAPDPGPPNPASDQPLSFLQVPPSKAQLRRTNYSPVAPGDLLSPPPTLSAGLFLEPEPARSAGLPVRQLEPSSEVPYSQSRTVAAEAPGGLPVLHVSPPDDNGVLYAPSRLYIFPQPATAALSLHGLFDEDPRTHPMIIVSPPPDAPVLPTLAVPPGSLGLSKAAWPGSAVHHDKHRTAAQELAQREAELARREAEVAERSQEAERTLQEALSMAEWAREVLRDPSQALGPGAHTHGPDWDWLAEDHGGMGSAESLLSARSWDTVASDISAHYTVRTVNSYKERIKRIWLRRVYEDDNVMAPRLR